MSRRVPVVVLGLAGLLALYIVLPFAAGLQQAGLADWRSVEFPTLERACAVSAASATLATALIALGGIPLGYVLARAPGRWIAALGFVVQLPLALPPLASGVLLLFLLGSYSPAGRLLGDITDTFWGVVMAQTFVAAPFLIIAARSAFASVDPVLEDVAATLGHGPRARFLRVALPLAWPGAQAGLLLAWLRAFGEFGATVMVAYHPYTLPVYTYVAFGAQGLPAMLPVLLPTLIVAICVMALSLLRPRRACRTPSGASPIPLPATVVFQPPAGAGVWAAPCDSRLEFSLRKRLGGFGLDAAWSPRARRLAILGPSGSGKSMTLRLLAGLETPDDGFVRVGGRALDQLPPEARGVAYVPQGYALLPDRDVWRQVLLPVGATPDAAAAWIARLGLSGLEDRRPAELSLGQQQRVALARALVRPAALVLLDEPFSALDAPLRVRLRRDLRELQRGITATTIVVTHDPDEAMQLADEIMLMENGRVLQTGAAGGVAAHPVDTRAAALLGLDLLDGVAASANSILVGNGVCLRTRGSSVTPALTPGRRVRWAVRREFVRLCADGDYLAEVEEVRPVAGGTELAIRLGDALLRALVAADVEPPKGACRLAISPGAIQFWQCPDNAGGRQD